MKYCAVLLTSLLLTSSVSAEPNKINFPENYQTEFTNYLSLDRTQNPDQVIRLFANDIAMQGADADGKLPYGSVIVAEVYKAKKDKDGKVVTSALNRRIRDKFALVAIMERGKGFGANLPTQFRNEDWDFAAFKPDGSPAAKDLNSCRSCHVPFKNLHHLFSYDHLK
ncbi:MAG: cytochrome P460 family protein [Motiliproteus sp.]|nr:cytochrome P460 family protein [Motiliproteus sp.]MCW9054284.1 cytochrome P460 family protein [Motiliproteus sp.]